MRLANLILLTAFLGWPGSAAAQRAYVELQVRSGAMEVGESTTIHLVCHNTGLPAAPQAVIPDGLELQLLNPTPSFNSIMQIVAGRRTSEENYTFSMKVTATKAGTYMLGPITVEAGSVTYSTDKKRIVVRKTEVGSGSYGDRFVYASLEVSPRSLYVTQSYTATLTFGVRKVEIAGRTYNMDMLRSVLDLRASELSVFSDGRADRSERWLTDSQGTRHRYEVFRVSKSIRAEEVGTLTVSPVFLKARYPTQVRRGFFGRTEVVRHRAEFARTDAIAVTVKAPPLDGRPPEFNGAIGRYALVVTAKPLRVDQGEPITLTVSIKGVNLEGVAGPDLTRHPELASRFDYTKDELVGDLERGAKVFRRAIFPKQIGNQTIPPVVWSYFDPTREAYVTRRSRPIDIVVEARTDSGATIALPDAGTSQAPETKLTLLSGGISPNFVDADEVLADHTFELTTPWLASMIATPLVWLAITLVASHRARIRSDGGFARRRGARRAAHKRIREAIDGRDVPQQMSALGDAITHYVSDRYDLGAGTLTADDVNTVLRAKEVDDSLVTSIVEFLEGCDAVRYTPGSVESLSPEVAAANARRWITQLEGGGA